MKGRERDRERDSEQVGEKPAGLGEGERWSDEFKMMFFLCVFGSMFESICGRVPRLNLYFQYIERWWATRKGGGGARAEGSDWQFDVVTFRNPEKNVYRHEQKLTGSNWNIRLLGRSKWFLIWLCYYVHTIDFKIKFNWAHEIKTNLSLALSQIEANRIRLRW